MSTSPTCHLWVSRGADGETEARCTGAGPTSQLTAHAPALLPSVLSPQPSFTHSELCGPSGLKHAQVSSLNPSTR